MGPEARQRKPQPLVVAPTAGQVAESKFSDFITRTEIRGLAFNGFGKRCAACAGIPLWIARRRTHSHAIAHSRISACGKQAPRLRACLRTHGATVVVRVCARVRIGGGNLPQGVTLHMHCIARPYRAALGLTVCTHGGARASCCDVCSWVVHNGMSPDAFVQVMFQIA